MQWGWLKDIILTARGAQLRFVGVLALLMVVTMVQTFVPFIRVPKLDEYRSPAPPPKIIQKVFHGDGRLAADINAWFDDRMGFRDVLARVSNQIDYSVFNYSKRVIMGKNGWLFYRGNFQASIVHTRNRSNLVVERAKLDLLSEFFKRRNIQLIIIGTPAKETLYGEFFLSGVPKAPVNSEFQKLREFLKAGDGQKWSYIDSQDIHARHKNDGFKLYFQADLHATTYGTLVVAKELVKRVAALERTDWNWNPQLDFVQYPAGGGSESRFLSVFTDLAELILEPREPYTANLAPGEVFEKLPPKPFETIFHNETGRPRLPRTVMFGSSFLDRNLAVGTYLNFDDVFRARGLSSEIGATLRAIPPGTRYFVFEFWEPHFDLLANMDIPSN